MHSHFSIPETDRRNPLAGIANDGLLGGSLVESDSEILKLPGLSRRDRVQFGSVEDMSSWEVMASTGLSPGRESGTPTTSGIEHSGTPDPIPEVVESTPVEPVRAHYPTMLCGVFGAKFLINRNAAGERVVTYLDCGKCDGCLLWRRFLNVRRFQHTATRTATVIDCPGHQTVDAARAAATRLSRVGAGARATTIQRGSDYLWTVFTVLATPVKHGPIADAMELWEMVGTIVDRPVSPAEFEARCPLAKTEKSTTEMRADGKTPKQRRLVLFHQWADYAEPECDYRLDDGVVMDTPVDDIGLESTPLTPEEMRRSKLPLEHRQYLYMRAWLPVGSTINRGTWDDFVGAVDAGDNGRAKALLMDAEGYHGPTRALRDTAGWLIDGANPKQWSEGYRPVLEAVGIATPTPTCCQCRREVLRQSDDGVCTRCKLGV